MLTSTLTLPPEVQATADDTLLAVRQPGLIMKTGAVTKRLKAKGGNTLRMSRYDRLPTAPVPLPRDGSQPDATPLNRVDIDGTVSFYGLFCAINQRVFLQNQDLVLQETAELLGLSMRMTEDQLTRDMLQATATVYNCTGGANGDLPTNLSPADLDEVTAALLGNDAWMMLDRQEGENRFGTGPIRNAYLMLCHTDLTPDLNNLPGFISQWNYPNQNKTIREEWGSYNNIRAMVSSVGSVVPQASRLGKNVYNSFVQGLESLCCVEQDNYSASIIYRPAIFSGALAQNITIGYTFAEVPRILNDLWLTNVRSTLY